MPRANWQGRNQHLAKKVRGDDVEFSWELLFQNIAGPEIDVPRSVRARVPPSDCAGERIIIDREDFLRAEITSRDRENAAPGSGVEHRPATVTVSSNAFQHSQTHRGRRMLAGA